MSHFSHLFFLHFDWLFQLFLLYDWLIKIVRLQTQNSEIYAKLIMPGTNQIAGINRYFRMDIIKKQTQESFRNKTRE